MNSKRFVFGLVGIVFGLICAIYALAWFWPEECYMTGGEYGAWMQQRDYAKSSHEAQEIILLGDSRMKIDVDPLSLDSSVYSLALSGCNPMDMYYTLRWYLQNNKKPKGVILGFAPTHFTHMENYTGRGLYFHYYSDAEVEEINANVLAYDRVDFRSEALKYKYRAPVIYLSGIVHSLKEKRQEENRKSYASLMATKGAFVLNGRKAEDDPVRPEEMRTRDFVPLKSLDYYFCQTIMLCKEAGIPIVVEQFPMGEFGVKHLKETGYYAEYHNYMENIRMTYDIPVVTDIPVYPNEFFADNSHLNKEGTQRFTQELVEKYRGIFW